jgi:hypothetical protein
MKRTAAKHARRPTGVDEGQIIEALRLTPTQRLEKLRGFMGLVEEVQRAAGLRTHHRKSHAATG